MRIEQILKNLEVQQKFSVPLFILSIGNLITCIENSRTFIDTFLLVFPFLAVSLIFLLVRFKIHYMVMSLIILIYSAIAIIKGEISDLTFVTLFCLSLGISKQKRLTYPIYFMIVSTLVIYKFTTSGLLPSQLSGYLAAASFIYISIDHYFLQPLIKASEPIDVITLESYYSMEVNNDVVDIIQNRVMGLDWPKINAKLGLNIKDSEVPRKVRNEKDRLGFKTQDQFDLWLFDKGIIKSKSDKLRINA